MLNLQIVVSIRLNESCVILSKGEANLSSKIWL